MIYNIGSTTGFWPRNVVKPRRCIMEASVIVFMVAVAGLLFLVGVLLGKLHGLTPRVRPAAAVSSPTDLQRKRLEVARRKVIELEEKAALEEALLSVEEDSDYHERFFQETQRARQTRRARKTSAGQQGGP